MKYWLNSDSIAGIDGTGDGEIATVKGGTAAVSGILKRVSEATIEDGVDGVEPRSIPHPWARAILMEKALFSGENAEVLVGAWRGFLTLFALKDIYDLTISVELIDTKIIENNVKGIGLTLWENKATIPENKEIHTLIPEASSHTYLFYSGFGADRIAIGMSNPKTMCIPGFCNEAFGYNRYPWTDGINFKDPLDAGTTHNGYLVISRGEKMILHVWLSKAIDYYTTAWEKEGVAPHIVDALESFKEDLNLSRQDITRCNQVNTIETHIGINRDISAELDPFSYVVNTSSQDFYSEINYAMPNRVVVNKQSEAAYIFDNNTRLVLGMFDTCMLLNRCKSREEQKRLAEKFHRGNITVGVIESTSSADLSEYLYKTCYYLDLSSIVRKGGKDTELIKNLKSLPNCITNNKLVVLPVRDDIEDKDLKDLLISSSNVEYNNHTVKISWSVTGDPMEKVFAGDNLVCMNKRALGSLSAFIWPFVRESKKYYYGSNLNSTDGGYIFLPPGGQVNKGNSGEITTTNYFKEMEQIPEYLECFMCSDDKDVVKIGVVGIKRPEGTFFEHTTAEYSLDFGTSSTVIAEKSEAAENIATIKNQTGFIAFDSEGGIDGRNHATEMLYASTDIVSPFPTIYKINEKSQEYDAPKGLFERGHAYFPINTSDIKWGTKHLKTDIKFGENNRLAYNYIESIINLILIDAKKHGFTKVKLNLSYPISIDNITTFKSGVHRVLDKYLTDDSGYGVVIDNIRFMTESEAAMRYYQTLAPNLVNKLIIDIGGGSADIAGLISLPSGEAFCNIASVAEGSRKFFLNTLLKTPRLLTEIVNEVNDNNGIVDDAYLEESTYRKIRKNNNLSQLEVLLTHKYGKNKELIFGNEMRDAFLAKVDTASGVLRSLWSFQIASFVYYSGLMFKKLYQDYKANHAALDVNILTLAFSGRGAAAIEWLPASYQKCIKALLESVLDFNGKKIDANIMAIDKNPKTESAIGMLSPSLIKGQDVLDESNFTFGFISGEKIKVVNTEKNIKDSEFMMFPHPLTDTAKNKENLLYSDDFKNSVQIIDMDFPLFNKFLSIYNENAPMHMLRVKLTDESRASIVAGEFLMPKNILKETASTYCKNFASSGTVDEPLFFKLVSAIRDELEKHIN